MTTNGGGGSCLNLKLILTLILFSVHISVINGGDPNPPKQDDLKPQTQPPTNATVKTTRVKRQGAEAIIGVKIKGRASLSQVEIMKVNLRDDNDEVRRRRRRSLSFGFSRGGRGHRSSSPPIEYNFVPYYGGQNGGGGGQNTNNNYDSYQVQPGISRQNNGAIVQNNFQSNAYGPTVHTHYDHSKYNNNYTSNKFYKNSATTRTQERFHHVNRNLAAAVKYQQSFRKDPAIKDIIVLNPDGVTCGNLCEEDEPEVTHGLLGICTPKYCNCHPTTVRSRRNYRQEECPSGHVFDPLKLSCDLPQNTVLCSDGSVPSVNVRGGQQGDLQYVYLQPVHLQKQLVVQPVVQHQQLVPVAQPVVLLQNVEDWQQQQQQQPQQHQYHQHIVQKY